MKQVDQIATEKFYIQLIQMMENAGKNLATIAKRILENSINDKYLIVAVGKSNNGGGGLVATRHLYNWGAKVTVFLPQEPLSGISEIQRKIIQNLPIQRKTGEKPSKAFI